MTIPGQVRAVTQYQTVAVTRVTSDKMDASTERHTFFG